LLVINQIYIHPRRLCSTTRSKLTKDIVAQPVASVHCYIYRVHKNTNLAFHSIWVIILGLLYTYFGVGGSFLYLPSYLSDEGSENNVSPIVPNPNIIIRLIHSPPVHCCR